MAGDGYTIKTDDGSLLGPMKLEAVEGFFKQGLVKHDNLVQRPGSYNWVPLSEILAKDLKQGAPAKKKKKAAPPVPTPAPQPARPRPPAARPESYDQRPAASSGGSGGALKALALVAVVAALGAGGFFAYQVMQRPAAPVAAPTPDPDAAQRLLREQRQKAIDLAAVETPQFSTATIEMLMSSSAAEVLEPREVFRRGQLAVSRGIGQLSAAESRELGGLMQAVYAPLSAKDRARLGTYLDRLKANAATSPEENQAVALVMKSGVVKLSKERRGRLQALFEKAARAGSSVR
jgi:hypothetical protein